MKILVFSDSHGNSLNLMTAIKRHGDAERYIHLGDGEKDLLYLETEVPEVMNKLIYIGGNCDIERIYKRTRVVELNGVRILLTHGDNHSVKKDKTVIARAAEKEGCTAAFFGHTHARYCETVNGIFLLNPGSCDMQSDGTKPSYAVVEIADGKITAEIRDVR